MRDDDYPIVAAIIRVGKFERAVLCNNTLLRQEANLLFVLGEHVSRLMLYDDICHRMRISENTLLVHACKLRKKLHYDWILQNVIREQRMRLCYTGSPLSKANMTYPEITPVVHGRVGLKHDRSTIEKIRATQIRNESWRNFHARA